MVSVSMALEEQLGSSSFAHVQFSRTQSSGNTMSSSTPLNSEEKR
jgi:hypothetical protein